jgi:two-component system, NtrC family, response regulator AtoC
MPKILIVDNDDGLIHFLSRLLVKQGYDVSPCNDGSAALRRLADEAFDTVLLDYKMPGLNGLETLVEIKRARIKTPVIIMTAHGTTETAIEAMKLGAYDYLLKPFDTEELKRIVADAISVSRLMKDVVSVAGATAAPVAAADAGQTKIVGSHRKMQAVFKLIGQVAEKDVTVLITGESGTGKELVARAMYHHSHRKDGPFMAVNCASIPDTLFESELFGYEQGAFTGADRTYLGKFERCHQGTIFFDEIGDMSLSTQAKVLRVLQEGEFERLGGSATIKVNVRVLAATNKNLEKEVEAGRFRQDLYYRLKIISIHLPPLRERLDDVPALVNYFVARFTQEYSKPIRFVSDAAVNKLRSYAWPGNVRQLENCMRRAVLTCKGDVLLPEHVNFEDKHDATSAGDTDDDHNQSIKQRIEALVAEVLHSAGPHARANVVDLVEEALIIRALQECGQNQVHAARMLGISRNTLRHRIKKYRLEEKRFPSP